MTKENSSKPIVRSIRASFMTPADSREAYLAQPFMKPKFTEDELKMFISNWDDFPLHFIKHPDLMICSMFLTAYVRMVDGLHLEPETEEKMDHTLTADRIIPFVY